MNRELRERLDAYINEHYEPSGGSSVLPDDGAFMPGTAKDSLSSRQVVGLKALLEELGMSFHEKLFSLIAESGMTDAEVYKRASIDRKLFSKIRINPAYHPRKETVVSLAVALKLDIEAAEDLLARAEYALSPSSKEDLVVKFFIKNRIFDIDAIHEAVQEYV